MEWAIERGETVDREAIEEARRQGDLSAEFEGRVRTHEIDRKLSELRNLPATTPRASWKSARRFAPWRTSDGRSRAWRCAAGKHKPGGIEAFQRAEFEAHRSGLGCTIRAIEVAIEARRGADRETGVEHLADGNVDHPDSEHRPESYVNR
ncbi:MAG: hypothetical protein U5L11_11690 [Arhodomonas sp.]|nr:hypothetical protein [Arhodomonas sp.]